MLMENDAGAGDLTDRDDFANADRGLIGTLEPMVVTMPDGRVVWDMDAWGFLDGDCPETVNPSLWRQAQLTAKHGLYEVTDGIYQVRGFDMSNMTLVEGDSGVIVIDPLISAETAAAALALYRRAPRRPARDRGDLHPRPHRPLRRRAGRGRRATPTSRSSRPSTSSSTRCRRTSTPATAMLRRALLLRRRSAVAKSADRHPRRSGSAPAARPAPPD